MLIVFSLDFRLFQNRITLIKDIYDLLLKKKKKKHPERLTKENMFIQDNSNSFHLRPLANFLMSEQIDFDEVSSCTHIQGFVKWISKSKTCLFPR